MQVTPPSANMGDTKLNWMKGHFSCHQTSSCNTFIHFIEHCASGSIKMSCNITENHLIQYIWQPKIDWGIDNIKFPASLFCECAKVLCICLKGGVLWKAPASFHHCNCSEWKDVSLNLLKVTRAVSHKLLCLPDGLASFSHSLPLTLT